MKEIFKKLFKYLLPLGLALILSLISWVLSYNNISKINTPYILSSIAQGFASLMALLFVIIFFLCQSTNRVSMLDQILKPDGYFLLGVFILTVLFPLFILKTVPNEFLIDFSIFLALFCLISLFPFVGSINRNFKRFGIINILSEMINLKHQQNKIRYQEVFEDLMEISSEQIVRLESNEIVYSLVQELGNAVSKIEGFHHKRNALRKASDLAIFSLIVYDNEEPLEYLLSNIIHNRINSAYLRGDIEFLNIILNIFNDLLVGMEKHKKNISKSSRDYTKETAIKDLIEYSMRLYKNQKEKDDNSMKKRLDLFEEKIIFLHNKDIFEIEDILEIIDKIYISDYSEDERNIYKKRITELLENKETNKGE